MKPLFNAMWMFGALGIAPLLGLAVDLPPPVEREVDFAREVLPILQQHCWSCHGGEMQESGLRLDQRAAAILGGDSGKVLVPGDSANSRLIEYVAGTSPDNVMPPEGELLSREEVGILRTWIDRGAKWPEAGSTDNLPSRHWAYQPLRAVAPPEVQQADWVVNPIDRFILRKLEERGLLPSPEADRHLLIRRLSLDLIGLPPTLEEVDAFVSDSRPTAYEELVDRLLDSPHFGERWGRHWLDMARYADSDGYEKDRPRPDAYLWRDWVIDALNQDMPFDQFTIEQLAGDLLPSATDMQKLATAFHRQTLTNTEGGTDQEQFRVEACFDRTETTGAVWLGLTVGCARCHTHKYDSITQREYYQLFAFFNNGDEQTHVVPKSAEEIAEYQTAKAAFDRELEEAIGNLRAEQAGLEPEFAIPKNIASILAIAPADRSELQQKELLDHLSRIEPSTKELIERVDAIKKNKPPKPELSVRVIFQRKDEPRQTLILRRGEFLEPILDAEVRPAGLATLHPLESRHGDDRHADRLDLAKWLVSQDNPLTPRVTVNHVWRQLFGTGLVATASDFGVRGEPPTHPQLLDWLASEFIGLQEGTVSEEGSRYRPGAAWSRKSLIKRIVMSATYRQSSKQRPELLDADPQNQFLARQNRLRVEAEIVRDISLDVAGLLSRKIGGPSVFPSLPAGIAELSYAGNFKWTSSEGADRYRRGMYTFFKRTSPHPNLITFDCPDANLTCVDRNKSNTPLQALVALNNDSFAEAARAFARRILTLPGVEEGAKRLEFAFRLCVARRPAVHELHELTELLSASRTWYAEHPAEAMMLIDSFGVESSTPAENAAWITTARVLINLDEFITRE